MRAARTVEVLPELIDAGVDIVQLREAKEVEAGDLLREGAPLLEICRGRGVPFIVNDRPDVALALGADGVHLGQNDVSPGIARRILGDAVVVGRSTHAEAEIDAELGSPDRLDYIAVGPVRATPSKPGRAGTGLGLLEYAAATARLPWFVTGGMGPDTLPEAIQAGARRAVVVRALTEAADPPAVASEMRSLLDAAS
jgi:thiamine-phosphate pyrophosphorylase